MLLVQGRDEFGNLLAKGGADVMASVQSVDGAAKWPASVTDLGNGTYTVTCTITQAGPVRATVSLGACVQLTVPGTCVAADVCPSRCAVMRADTHLAAGA